MISGVVTWRNEPTLPLQIYNDAGDEISIEAVIDTGFSGYLTLSQADIDSLFLPFLKTDVYELGDGSEVVFTVYKGNLGWDGKTRSVLVLSAEGGALVGMNLLKGANVSMHVVDGGLVTIKVEDSTL